MAESTDASFFTRHEFVIRRLHSLCGLIPVGAYMIVHLLVNASLLDGAATFQRAVFGIHSLGALLPVVEWGFIFIPILFHAIFGVMIISGSVPNTTSYPYSKNYRYYAQRATGMIAFGFIVYHVFHMHGWFHFDVWTKYIAEPLGGYQFRPYNAASTTAAALQGTGAIFLWIIYLIGMLSCVFHLANGIWTMGITWGAWVTPVAQQRASNVCLGFGALLALVGIAAIYAPTVLDVDEARATENLMLEERIRSGDVKPNPHKQAEPAEHTEVSQLEQDD